MSTRALIAPLVIDTYGDGPMVDAFLDHLAKEIDAYDETKHSRDRETFITLLCWDWFSGGDTAANLADRIEEVLEDD